jgi:hypothetical protein
VRTGQENLGIFKFQVYLISPVLHTRDNSKSRSQTPP